jgi:hypothetical protein
MEPYHFQGGEARKVTATIARGQWRSYNYTDRFIRHRNFLVYISLVADEQARKDSEFAWKPGLADRGDVFLSLEAYNFPSYFLRHQGFRLQLQKRDGSRQYDEDATFTLVPGIAGSDVTLESYNYRGYFLRHENFELWLSRPQSTVTFRSDATFHPVYGTSP